MNSITNPCAICFGEIVSLNNPNESLSDQKIIHLHANTPTPHPFHASCLYEWFATKIGELDCPLCRADVRRDEQVLLYFWRLGINHAATVDRNPEAKKLLKLLKQATSAQEKQEHEISYAITQGGLKIIEILIKNNPIDEATRGRLVIQAAKKGNLKIVQLLLNDSNTISGEDLWKAYCEAKIEQYEDVAQFFSDINPAQLATKRGKEVIQAAEKRDLQLVQFLLPDHAIISDEDRIQAAIKAIPVRFHPSPDYIDIVVFLLKDLTSITTPISVSDRGLFIRTLAKSDHLEIIQLLLQGNAPIVPDAWIHSISNAIITKHFNTLQFLWEYLPTHLQSLSHFSQAFLVATINGDLPTVQFLLERNIAPLPDGLLDSAILQAKDSNHSTIVEFLLNFKPGSLE